MLPPTSSLIFLTSQTGAIPFVTTQLSPSLHFSVLFPDTTRVMRRKSNIHKVCININMLMIEETAKSPPWAGERMAARPWVGEGPLTVGCLERQALR